jgi:dTDP-N-acetylfucosamine:lipid II N-acetylfucosaminyltransferase
MFGDIFHPIIGFLEFSKYVNLLMTCPVVIMNYKRQQGAGNIGITLFLGSKIFMNADSLFYAEYLEQQLIVFKIKDIQVELDRSISGLGIEKAYSYHKYLQRMKSFDEHVNHTQALTGKIKEVKSTNADM